MNTARALDTFVRLSCARCSTSHRVRDIYALKPGMKATCASCRAPFVVVAMPTTGLNNAGFSPVVDAAPHQDVESVDREGVRTEDTQRPGSKRQRAVFYGTGGTLFGIHLVNTLLTLATLGFYYYWAKVRVRTFLFSQTEFAGDRFSYHGSARELLNGALKAGLIFGVPYFVLENAGPFLGASMAIQIGLQTAAWLLLFLFIPFAISGARRYRLSRTAWRGIRFSFQGNTLHFIKLWLLGYFLTGVTLGLYYPYFSTKKHAFLTAHSYFGSEPFKFSGNGAALFRPFLTMYLSAVTVAFIVGLGLYSFIEFPMPNFTEPETMGPLVIGAVAGLLIGALVLRLLWLPYSVKEQRFFWEQTSIGASRFQLPITLWPYLKLKLGNLLFMICTLGLAWPWITIRNIQFMTDHLTLVGADNFNEIVQAYDGAPPIGEGLDGFLDTGFDLG
ncbi:MAG: DUF898 domain-containing protein [Nitrospira sp.]|nr:MAG: DUF898 domain-containing protein [Nitrospira sp.]